MCVLPIFRETNLNRVQSQSVESLDNLDKEKGEMVQISDAPELVQPAEVVVTEKVMERADSVVLTPFGMYISCKIITAGY